MPHADVRATALARNFSEFPNRVRYQGVTLDVTRGNDVIRGCAGLVRRSTLSAVDLAVTFFGSLQDPQGVALARGGVPWLNVSRGEV